jgi:hypothetical protein
MTKLKFKRSKDLKTGGRKHVPLPSGPFKVIGCRDIMTGTSGKDSGILVRLFYPALDQERDIRQQHLVWPNWLPHEKYRKGYADVGEVKSPTAIKLINWLVGSAFIPCVSNAKPFRDGTTKFPVVILSHGVGGCRTVSSGICLEMASNGYLVVSLEHRDGTACTTFYADEVKIPLYQSNPDLALPIQDGMMLLNPSGEATTTHPKSIDSQTEVPHGRRQKVDDSCDDTVPLRRNGSPNMQSPPKSGKRHHNTSSIIPKTVTEWIDFRVIPEGGKGYYDIRNEQIHVRVQECIKAADLTENLNNGVDVGNILDGLFDPKEFFDLLDLDKIILMGHSMGAASCLVAGDADTRFKALVCLDTWMYPIHKERLTLKQPVIFINSEKFQSKANLRKMSELLLSQSDKESVARKVLTIRGSVHHNQTDFPFVFSFWAKMMYGGSSRRNPFTAHDLTTSIALTFLRDNLGIEEPKLPERDSFIARNKRKLKEGFPKKL